MTTQHDNNEERSLTSIVLLRSVNVRFSNVCFSLWYLISCNTDKLNVVDLQPIDHCRVCTLPSLSLLGGDEEKKSEGGSKKKRRRAEDQEDDQ